MIREGLLLCFVTFVGASQFIKVYDDVINASSCEQMVEASKSFGNASIVSISGKQAWIPWDELLFEQFSNKIRDYSSRFVVSPTIHEDTGYTLIIRTPADDSTAPMVGNPPTLVLGMLLFLNQDVGGGELLFPQQNGFRVDPECGRLVVWPNTFTHPHALNAVRIGEERFIMSWMRYKL